MCTSPSQKIANPGFEGGSVYWTATQGVIGQYSGSESPHSGTWDAWLDGYGFTYTDTVSQIVKIPAGCKIYMLSFWLHVDSTEVTTIVKYDTLTVS